VLFRSQYVSLSNCFVLDTTDSFGGICRTDERMSQIYKRRGGAGADLSPIRPKGLPTKNGALTTDGIVPFMEKFSNTTRGVAQDSRRGALMLSLSVHHPEIMTFIRAKTDLKKITGANISIRVSDEFMKAVKENKNYELRWPVDSKKPVVRREVSAKEVWDELIKSNYGSGEPGVLYWDTIIRNSPADSYSDQGMNSCSTNPCGELPLPNLDSCRLMSLNLSGYVISPFTPEAKFNEKLFESHVGIAQKLMDDMIDLEIEAVTKIIKKVENDPEPDNIKRNELELWNEIREKCEQGRRTGLGITGLGDCIAMLNQKYGSEESIKTVDHIYKTLRDFAYLSSIEMAKDRGAFPIFNANKEKNNEYLNRLPEKIKKEMWKVGRRNIGLLTTPPAGSLSTLTQTSSGFEPVFLAEYERKRKLNEGESEKPDFVDAMGDKWKKYTVYHHKIKLFKSITGKEFKDSPYFGAISTDIDYIAKVRMQAVATSYVDHAISNTTNLPNNIDIETVQKIYMLAWELGCKGITVYREGSRDGVLTKIDSKNTRSCDDCDEAGKKLKELVEQGNRPTKIILSPAPKRQSTLTCEIHRSKIGKKDWLFFVGMHDGQPYEVFGGVSKNFTIPHKYKDGWILKNGKNKQGVTQYHLILGSLEDSNEKLEFKDINKHFNNKEYGAFTRLVSLSLRHGTPIKYICEQITKTGCAGDLFSFQRAMSRILKKYIADGEKSHAECPLCKSTDLTYKNGCPTCKVCGNSNCS